MNKQEIKKLIKRLDIIAAKCDELGQKIAILKDQNDQDIIKVKKLDQYFLDIKNNQVQEEGSIYDQYSEYFAEMGIE